MIFGRNNTAPARGIGRRGAILLLAAIGLGGCGGILDVENPNNLVEEELNNPTAATSIVNGAAGTVARAIGALLGIYSTVTDEASWRGSRDAWRELDQGFLANERNEFTDDAFRYIAQARWMADEAIARMKGFDAEQQLTDRNQLARAYLFGALAYITIADMFDDFTLSNREKPEPPIGPTNMVTLYDTAIVYLDRALPIAQATNSATLQTQILGLRARAKYSKALWNKLNPKGQVPADPLISDPGATADAAAALARMPQDFRWVLTLVNDTLAIAGEASLAYNLYRRGELSIEAATRDLRDPISDQPDPVVQATLTQLAAANVYQPITIVSAREMRLILAEAALAQGDMAEFTVQINALRALNALPAYTGQIAARDLLIHSRRANLLLQGRRLADMYRFGIQAPLWQTSPPSTAVSRPGTFLPITCIEVRSHPSNFPDINC